MTFEENGLSVDGPQFETRFINVLDKVSDQHRSNIYFKYGALKIHHNGYSPRTRHEVYSGLKVVEQLGVNIHSSIRIYNLPFTVLSQRNKPAETAFTDRHPDFRHIFLVPDHTPTKILQDKAWHAAGIEGILEEYRGHNEIEARSHAWLAGMEILDVGQRVAQSILHEYGHILAYNAMDHAGLVEILDLYDWLDDNGYLDNCSKRIEGFGDSQAPSEAQHALIQLNVALEQIAEDYRVGQYVKCEDDVCPLPHALSYKQDLVNPTLFLEGVEIVKKMLNTTKTQKAIKRSQYTIDSIVPFGEANRSDTVLGSFGNGSITPLTTERKRRSREALKHLIGQ